jgi:hypothetical protein
MRDRAGPRPPAAYADGLPERSLSEPVFRKVGAGCGNATRPVLCGQRGNARRYSDPRFSLPFFAYNVGTVGTQREGHQVG